MAKNLTTVFLYKEYTGENFVANDAKQLTRLIDQVSQAIAAYCDRVFELTTYKAWYDGTGENVLALPQWPITRVQGVSFDTVNVASVKNTTAKWASVTIKDETLYLDSVATDGTETNSSLAFSTYKIVSTLMTAVDALSGWTSSTITGKGDEPTVLLRDIDGEWAVDPEDADLDIADELNTARLQAGTNQTIQRPCGTVFPAGHKNVFVWYRAGYTLPVDDAQHSKLDTAGNVPDDLTLIANEMLSSVFQTAGKEFIPGMKSEKIGNYSYSLGDGASAAIQLALKDHKAALAPHRSSKIV